MAHFKKRVQASRLSRLKKRRMVVPCFLAAAVLYWFMPQVANFLGPDTARLAVVLFGVIGGVIAVAPGR